MRIATIPIILALTLLAGCSSEGDGAGGTVATATLGVDSSAWDIVSKSFAAYARAESGHVVTSTTVDGSGSKLSIEQDMLFDENVTYIETTILGIKTLILERSGAACVKEPGQDWRQERLLDLQSPRTGGGILSDLNGLSYDLLERLPDSRTEDGQETFVIQGTFDDGTLALMRDALNQQELLASQPRIEEMSMVAEIEKESLQVRGIRVDMEFTADGAPFTMTTRMKIDSVGEPIDLPDDVPETCPGNNL